MKEHVLIKKDVLLEVPILKVYNDLYYYYKLPTNIITSTGDLNIFDIPIRFNSLPLEYIKWVTEESLSEIVPYIISVSKNNLSLLIELEKYFNKYIPNINDMIEKACLISFNNNIKHIKDRCGNRKNFISFLERYSHENPLLLLYKGNKISEEELEKCLLFLKLKKFCRWKPEYFSFDFTLEKFPHFMDYYFKEMRYEGLKYLKHITNTNFLAKPKNFHLLKEALKTDSFQYAIINNDITASRKFIPNKIIKEYNLNISCYNGPIPVLYSNEPNNLIKLKLKFPNIRIIDYKEDKEDK